MLRALDGNPAGEGECRERLERAPEAQLEMSMGWMGCACGAAGGGWLGPIAMLACGVRKAGRGALGGRLGGEDVGISCAF